MQVARRYDGANIVVHGELHGVLNGLVLIHRHHTEVDYTASVVDGLHDGFRDHISVALTLNVSHAIGANVRVRRHQVQHAGHKSPVPAVGAARFVESIAVAIDIVVSGIDRSR